MELNLRDLKKNIGDCQNLVGDCKEMIGDCKEMMRDMTMMLGEMLAAKTRNKSSAPFSVSTASSSSSSSLSPIVSSGIAMPIFGSPLPYGAVHSPGGIQMSVSDEFTHSLLPSTSIPDASMHCHATSLNSPGGIQMPASGNSVHSLLLSPSIPCASMPCYATSSLFCNIPVQGNTQFSYPGVQNASPLQSNSQPGCRFDDGVGTCNNDMNLDSTHDDYKMKFKSAMKHSLQNFAPEMNIILLNPEQINWFHDKISSMSDMKGYILFQYTEIPVEHIENMLIQRGFEVCGIDNTNNHVGRVKVLQNFYNQELLYSELKQFSGEVEIMSRLIHVNFHIFRGASYPAFGNKGKEGNEIFSDIQAKALSNTLNCEMQLKDVFSFSFTGAPMKFMGQMEFKVEDLHFEGMHKILGTSIFIIWNWYYKDIREFFEELGGKFIMIPIHRRPLDAHPGTWIVEWKIAWLQIMEQILKGLKEILEYVYIIV